ncbi:uncharacterized protein AMSG_11904 [Thecamonas trahens ATCC 50062]|uniref:RING-type domain-containing protein n=1 Tax=Thecamonas trahens ATCC 50062 TaxID=461836 RepID=A0A0L0DC92_THETB|nr:hypothetical protein AMSG_11904 [Thecamonas trahens ATCC 50062]KNC49964.1 hypothetical protein AMSG_11904 [Thecamonas trahens ATCC 50062]|eukprot:XP_013757297.1 hypothetical protein AMSG_11904 [Thecamonas trahens ATCC 50062]
MSFLGSEWRGRRSRMRTSPSSNFISDMQDVVNTIRMTRTSSTQYLDRLLDTYGSALDPSQRPRPHPPQTSFDGYTYPPVSGGTGASGVGGSGGGGRAEYLHLPDGAGDGGGGHGSISSGDGSSMSRPLLSPQATPTGLPPLAFPLVEGSRIGGGGGGGGGGDGIDDGADDSAPMASSAGTPRSARHSRSLSMMSGRSFGGEEMPQVELPSFRQLVESGVPFVLILLTIFMFHHLVGIAVSLWLGTVFYFSNVHLKVHVARRAERSRGVLAGILAAMVVHVAVVQKLFRSADLDKRLLLLPPPEPLPLDAIVWALVLNDFCVRFVAIALKAGVVMWWSNWGATRERGQILSMIELTLNLYRSVLPIPLWYTYFTTQDYGVVLSALLTLQYVASKLYLLTEHVALYLDSLLALWRAHNQFSVPATKAQIMEHGDICPICQDDFEDAVILPCKHMFCESCVTEWFHYNKTCPMCRAEIPIAETIARSDGHTSMMAILFYGSDEAGSGGGSNTGPESILPLPVGAGVTLLRLGSIVVDRLAFHSRKYVYPAGYKSSRSWWSAVNPTEHTTYTSEVIDAGGRAPIFRVTPADNPESATHADNATGAWTPFSKIVNEARGISFNVSGPHFYGFSSSITRALIESLPGISDLANYIPMDAELRASAEEDIRKQRALAAAASRSGNTSVPRKRKRSSKKASASSAKRSGGVGGDGEGDDRSPKRAKRMNYAAPEGVVVPRLMSHEEYEASGLPRTQVRFIKAEPEYDEHGMPVMPVEIGHTVVIALGKIVHDRPGFHSTKYIWPVGFRSVRKFPSIVDPEVRVPYYCEIADGGHKPIFRLTPSDRANEAFEGDSATGVWRQALASVNDTKIRLGQTDNMLLFGFANNTVAFLIQNLPKADKCPLYRKQVFALAVPRNAAETRGRPTISQTYGSQSEAYKSSRASPRAGSRAALSPLATHSEMAGPNGAAAISLAALKSERVANGLLASPQVAKPEAALESSLASPRHHLPQASSAGTSESLFAKFDPHNIAAPERIASGGRSEGGRGDGSSVSGRSGRGGLVLGSSILGPPRIFGLNAFAQPSSRVQRILHLQPDTVYTGSTRHDPVPRPEPVSAISADLLARYRVLVEAQL